MPAKINLLNQHFGKLTVIEETIERRNKSVVWKCKCECGNIVYYSTKELRSDGIIQCPQCGCSRQPQTNLIKKKKKKKYNHLTVLDKSDKRSGGKILYKCECDCYNHTITYVSRTDLQNGHIKSCGCIKQKYKINDIINNRQIINIDTMQSNSRFYYKCKCLLCGREYDSLAQTLEKTFSCGCQKSIGEYNIIQVLNKNNIKFKKEFCFPNSNFKFDFALLDKNNNIIKLIEFDGEQHYENNVKNSGWNTYEKYEYTLQNDLKKNKLAKEKQIPLIRIPYWERNNISLDLIMSNKYLV